MDYQGTLLLVSHDRAFLDNVVTSSLVFEGGGVVGEYVGGYSDWLRQKTAADKPARKTGTDPVMKEIVTPAAETKPVKLSYKDQRELGSLPAKIGQLETEQAQLQAAIGDPGFYQQSHEQVNVVLERLQAVEEALEACYGRWEVLEP